MLANQIIQFSVPRFYDDISIRIGGNAYQIPFISIGQTVIPFVAADFSAVDRRPVLDDLATFFGIADSFGKPVLTGTGRGRNLLNALRLSSLDAELTPLYGYPNWLNLSLKDWIKYEMTKENNRWLALNQNTGTLQTALSNWAANYTSAIAYFKKIQYVVNGLSEVDTKTQTNNSFFYFDTLSDGAEYKKFLIPSTYLDITQPNDKAINVLLPKPYKIKDLQYFNMTVLGDKSIDLTAFNVVKDANDLAIDFYCVAPPALLRFSAYPIFDPEPNLDYSASGGIDFICTYDEVEKGENYTPDIPKTPISVSPSKSKSEEIEEPETEETEELPTPPKPKTELNLSPTLLISVFLFIFLIIVLQKASK